MDDIRNWETIYEVSGDKFTLLNKRLKYLKGQGIRCRLKNNSAVAIGMMGRGTMSSQLTARLQVRKTDVDMAYRYLADYNK